MGAGTRRLHLLLPTLQSPAQPRPAGPTDLLSHVPLAWWDQPPQGKGKGVACSQDGWKSHMNIHASVK